jgi:two-component system, sensor histidine kinase
MKRRDLSVGQRLAIGSVAVAVLIVSLGMVLTQSVSRIRSLQAHRANVIAPRVAAAEELKTALYRQAVAFRNYVITSSPDHLEAFRQAEQEVERRMTRLATLPGGRDEESFITKLAPMVANHRSAFETFLRLSRGGADAETLRGAEAEITANRAALLNTVDEYAVLQAGLNQQATRSIARAIDRLGPTVLLVTVLILLASFTKTFIVSRSVREPASKLIAAAGAMQQGSFEPAIALQNRRRPDGRPFRDELSEAAHVFGQMASDLKAREERLGAYARLSAVLTTSLNPSDVAASALRQLSEHIGAEVAVIYLHEAGTATLRPLSTIGLSHDVGDLAVGEGIPGQAALDRSSRVIRNIPADTPFQIRLGIDQLVPRTVVATPMIIGERLVGIMVLGSLLDIGEDSLEFIEHAAGQVAVTLDNALAHVHIAGLAAELQDKNESLQAQNEELQTQGEELQTQSEELQSQNEELQAQAEELQTQADELHSQAEELRAQQSALARTNTALAHAEEQKNRFLAVLGHELRNPLAAISGAIALLDDSGDDEERTHDVVRRQTAHLASLLDDLLDVGRITSGKIVLERRSLELGTIAQHCVDLLAAPQAHRESRIGVEVDQPVWIEADETRIEQIITNLLTNALKFTPADGAISVFVGAESGEAVLTVTDTGIGIDHDLLPRIFDFFVQGPRGLDGNSGLGVGLTLVRKLTELHGGSVKVDSDGPGQGTKFTLRFPSVAQPTMVLPGSPDETPRIPIRRSVVVVEDNPDVRRMIQLWLKKAGHDVSEAYDGPSGVEVVTAARPDVALIDLDLPGFDGCEVARRLRLDPEVKGIRLIAVSGYGRPEDRQRALEAGFDDHFVKPLDLKRLSSVLMELRGAT